MNFFKDILMLSLITKKREGFFYNINLKTNK